jgi:threonyl-tRNA synthetase
LCIHCASLGAHERFIGGSQSPASSRRRLHAGNFPLWLAPDRERVITLNNDEALINYTRLLDQAGQVVHIHTYDV